MGSELPLGFFSFSIGMLLLGTQSLGWIPAPEQRDVGMILVAFVFPLELVATLFAFLARDTLGATTLGLFGASWVTLGWSEITAKPGATSTALGVYLFGFAAIALLLASLSTFGKPLFSVLLLAAAARMALSGIYEVGRADRARADRRRRRARADRGRDVRRPRARPRGRAAARGPGALPAGRRDRGFPRLRAAARAPGGRGPA